MPCISHLVPVESLGGRGALERPRTVPQIGLTIPIQTLVVRVSSFSFCAGEMRRGPGPPVSVRTALSGWGQRWDFKLRWCWEWRRGTLPAR